MKNLLTTIAITLICFSTYSQCEDAFFSFEKGKVLEYTEFDKDSQPLEKRLLRIISVSETLAIVKKVAVTKKGKEMDQGNFTISCDNGDIQIDINQYIPDRIWQKFKGREMKIEGNFFILPKDLNEGQVLPDGSVEITMDIDARTTWKVYVDVTERTVIGQETILSPTSLFETYKVIEHVNTSIDLGTLQEYTSFYQTSWYAKNIGLVKRYRSSTRRPQNLGYYLLTKID